MLETLFVALVRLLMLFLAWVTICFCRKYILTVMQGFERHVLRLTPLTGCISVLINTEVSIILLSAAVELIQCPAF